MRSCRNHQLPYLLGIAFHKGDDAVVVFGVGVAYATALHHFQCPQIDLHCLDAPLIYPCGKYQGAFFVIVGVGINAMVLMQS